MPDALDDPQTRTDLAATRAGALRWVGGGAVAVVLAVLLGVATVRMAEDGGRLPYAGLVVVGLVLGGIAAVVAGAGALLRVAVWTRALASTGWRHGTLRIAGPAALRIESADGGDDVDLRLLSTATWRTRAVQKLAGGDVRYAPVGRDRWVLTADGLGTLYGARRP